MSLLNGRAIIAFRNRRGLSVEDFASIVGMPEHVVTEMQKAEKFDDSTEELLFSVGVIAISADTPTPVPAPVRKFSNSEIQTFKRCRRKWWLGWYRGLAPKQIVPVGVMASGSRIHKALESVYATGGPYHDRALESLSKAIESDRTFVKTYLPDDDEIRRQFEDSADLERIMLSGYIDWLEETGADSEFEVIAPETYVEMHVGNTFPNRDVSLIGKLDVLVRRVSDGRTLFIDHKNVGSFSRSSGTLHINEQMLHYILIINSTSDHVVTGAIYNMLRRVKRTERAKPPFYQRIEITHNPKTVESFKTRLRGTIEDILTVETILKDINSDSIHSVVYPTPSTNCTWDCPFFSVCPMFDDGSRVEEMIDANFEVIDPLAYYERKNDESE